MVVQAIGQVMSAGEYKKMLMEQKDGVNKKMIEILKIAKFRQEVVANISLNLNRVANMPNYVAAFGNDFEFSIKYSKGTLIQVLIAQTFNMTLYEVPRITFIAPKFKLQDEEISQNHSYKSLEVHILDNYSVHSEITDAFKNLSCEALSDTIKYLLTQMNLPTKKQNKNKLDVLSNLMISRLLPTIQSFMKDEKTKEHSTDYNWNVIMGQITEMKSNMGNVYTSHPICQNSSKCNIMFYQKMQINFVMPNGKQKKCECIVYCQKYHYQPLGIQDMFDNIREIEWFSIDTIHYTCFIMMMVMFFVGNKQCGSWVRPVLQGELENMSLRDQFCESKDKITLNVGVCFLCLVAGRAYY